MRAVGGEPLIEVGLPVFLACLDVFLEKVSAMKRTAFRSVTGGGSSSVAFGPFAVGEVLRLVRIGPLFAPSGFANSVCMSLGERPANVQLPTDAEMLAGEQLIDSTGFINGMPAVAVQPAANCFLEFPLQVVVERKQYLLIRLEHADVASTWDVSIAVFSGGLEVR